MPAYLAALLVIAAGITLPAQEADWQKIKQSAPKVFLDCRSCDSSYIKTEIGFVNYVRDRREADLHILVTTLATAGGGSEYTIAFIGQKRFAGQGHTLKYYSNHANTWDEVRAGIVRTLKMGLVAYAAQTGLAGHIEVDFRLPQSGSQEVVDRWHNWVFDLRSSGSIYKEESRSSNYLSGSFSANRVTPSIKMGFYVNGSFNWSSIRLEEGDYTYSMHNYGMNATVVKSLGDHWSLGGFASYSSSTYGNTPRSCSLAPALEYDIFPYQESTRKQLILFYRLGVRDVAYADETIYGKIAETLFYQSLAFEAEMTQPWGSLYGSLEGSHYFHDLSCNRLSLYLGASVRLLKGLSVSVSGSMRKINDQLSLVKGELSEEEILLQLKQMATSYSYRLSFGVSFSFGSIYSNVVNPRFSGRGVLQEG